MRVGFRTGFAAIGVLWLSACGGPPSGDMGRFASLECVPFARALSGIQLRGDAYDWWWGAPGRYDQGRAPAVGAAMVFAPSRGLPRGHVSVVSRVVGPRQILVTHANWVHHRVTTDQLVVDDSPYGDWSVARVWWPPVGGLGSTDYPVLGFIYPGHAASHDALVSAVSDAIQVAQGR